MEEDESGSDWDDLSSKDSVKASLTPNGVSTSFPKGISTSPHDQNVKDKVSVREKPFPRVDQGTKDLSTSSGIEGQHQITVKPSHIPALDVNQASISNTTPHPIAAHSSPVISDRGNNSESVRKAVKGATFAQTSNTPTSLHAPFQVSNSGGRSPAETHTTPGSSGGQPLLQNINTRPTFPPMDQAHAHPPLPPTNRTHAPPSSGPHSVYMKVVDRIQEENIVHAKLEETGGEDDGESNAFGIPEDMNMAISEEGEHKKSVR